MGGVSAESVLPPGSAQSVRNEPGVYYAEASLSEIVRPNPVASVCNYIYPWQYSTVIVTETGKC